MLDYVAQRMITFVVLPHEAIASVVSRMNLLMLAFVAQQDLGCPEDDSFSVIGNKAVKGNDDPLM
jgi:hypothetical protein